VTPFSDRPRPAKTLSYSPLLNHRLADERSGTSTSLLRAFSPSRANSFVLPARARRRV
jgi:hypothetical protein